jgi:hypothetical protein
MIALQETQISQNETLEVQETQISQNETLEAKPVSDWNVMG